MSSIYGQGGLKGATGGAQGNKIPKGYEQGQLQQFTPEQMQLFKSLFAHLMPGSQLSNLAGGDESAFEQIEAPAFRQFSAWQGNLASRFSEMGGVGARRSSGFRNTLNQAGSDLAENLASKRQGIQRQALEDLMGMSHTLLGERPHEQFLTQKPPSFLDSIIGGFGYGLGKNLAPMDINKLSSLAAFA